LPRWLSVQQQYSGFQATPLVEACRSENQRAGPRRAGEIPASVQSPILKASCQSSWGLAQGRNETLGAISVFQVSTHSGEGQHGTVLVEPCFRSLNNRSTALTPTRKSRCIVSRENGGNGGTCRHDSFPCQLDLCIRDAIPFLGPGSAHQLRAVPNHNNV
jgi:hypothetical protein